MKSFKVEILESENNKKLLEYIFESNKTLAEAQEFFWKFWPTFFDLMIMLLEDQDTWVKKKTLTSLNVLTWMFLNEEWKANCSTKFIVSEYKEEPKKDSNSIEELVEKLWGKAVKLESKEDLKEILSMIEKLIK